MDQTQPDLAQHVYDMIPSVDLFVLVSDLNAELYQSGRRLVPLTLINWWSQTTFLPERAPIFPGSKGAFKISLLSHLQSCKCISPCSFLCDIGLVESKIVEQQRTPRDSPLLSHPNQTPDEASFTLPLDVCAVLHATAFLSPSLLGADVCLSLNSSFSLLARSRPSSRSSPRFVSRLPNILFL